MRSIGWFVVLRYFAPRRVCPAYELMVLRVVVNMSVLPRLERSAAHKLLVLAGGIRWQRWRLVVRECTGQVRKKPGVGVRSLWTLWEVAAKAKESPRDAMFAYIFPNVDLFFNLRAYGRGTSIAGSFYCYR